MAAYRHGEEGCLRKRRSPPAPLRQSGTERTQTIKKREHLLRVGRKPSAFLGGARATRSRGWSLAAGGPEIAQTAAAPIASAMTGQPSRFGRRLRIGFVGGNGCHPAMIRTQRLASALSVISGKQRRSSATADNSPPCCRALRMAVAVASSTANMPLEWGRPGGRASDARGGRSVAPSTRNARGAPAERIGRRHSGQCGTAQA